MSDVMPNTTDAGPSVFFWVLFFLVPTLLAVLASALMTRDVKRVSGLWFLYEVSRLVGYMGIVIAAGLTISAAVRRVSSTLLIVLMTLSIGGAALLLWCAAHAFRRPW